MRRVRVRGIAALLLAGALAGAAVPAGAAPRLTEVKLRTSGSVRVVWHGDRARGCAAAGLCGYRGSIVYPFRRGSGFIDRVSGGQGSFGILESRGNTTVRTERTVAGGRPAVCVSRPRSQAFTLVLSDAWRDRHWLSVGTDISPAVGGSGQCAGPRIDDFAGSLPSALMRRNGLDRRGARLSLAGRFPFRSGPISGEVISTLAVRSRRVRRTTLRGSRGGGERPGEHQLYVELRYRVPRIEGELRNDFRAVEAPICKVRDACGARGSQVHALEGGGEILDVRGFATTKSRRPPSLKRALRKVVRDGILTGLVSLRRGSGLSTHAFVRPGDATCTDRFRPRSPPVVGLFGGEGRLELAMFHGEASTLEGRCPGPADPQDSEIAQVRVSRGQLLKRTIRLHLRSRRELRAGAYRETRTTRVNLRLRRTRARVLVDPDLGGEGAFFISESFSGNFAAARQRP